MKSDQDPFSESDASDTMLDELLAQARWPEADAGAVQRLEAEYLRAAGGNLRLSTQPRVVATRRDSHWMVRSLVAVAAVVLVASGVWLVLHQHGERAPIIAVKPVMVPPPPSNPAIPRPEPIVRELGATERLVLIADKRRVATKKSASTQPSAPTDALASLRRLDNATLTRVAMQTHDTDRRSNAIQALLQRNQLQPFLYFVLKSDSRAQALAVLDRMPNPPIRALLAELNHQQVDYRLAAAKALGGLCDHGVGPTLMTMVEQNDHRREAIAALLSCSDPHAKQFLTQAQAYASADEIRSVQHDLNKTF